jgi:phage baseplate assembly protein W
MTEAQAFLGVGWGFPPRFGLKGGEVQMVSGHDDIEQSLRILLATSRGERVMAEDYGCDLHNVVFEEISDGLVNRLSALITDAILYHEPRVTLEGVEVAEDPREHGLLRISVAYTVRSTNSRYNMVFPFYLYEASMPLL